ncbi:carbohydrate-binding domain-containing protein [Cellulomonas soli]
MRRPTLKLLIPAALTAALLVGCSSTTDSTSTTSSGGSATVIEAATDANLTVEAAMAANTATEPVESTWDESAEVTITLTGSSATVDGDGVSVDGSTITITAPGTYRVSGTLDDGSLVVSSAGDGLVRIVLDDASLSSSTTSPLQVTDASAVAVVLEDGTTNSLSDASEYASADTSTETDAPNAALYSTADLTITGTGSLDVHGNANDGIASKDGLVIESGTLTVDAVDDAIRGKDSVVVNGGTLTLTAGGDGLKSDNDEDAALGYIYLADGDVTVTAGDDGLTATTDVIVGGGTLTVESGGGAGATVAADASPRVWSATCRWSSAVAPCWSTRPTTPCTPRAWCR